MRSHVLKNALIPVVTVLGLQLGTLIGGAVITEYVFALPGVGRLVVDAVFARDYPLVQGVVLLIAVGFILSNLMVDLLYGLDRSADPSIAERVSALATAAPARSPRARRWVVLRRAAGARLAPFGVAVLLAALVVAALAPVISPHDPLKQNLGNALARPSRASSRSAPTMSGATCCRG